MDRDRRKDHDLDNHRQAYIKIYKLLDKENLVLVSFNLIFLDSFFILLLSPLPKFVKLTKICKSAYIFMFMSFYCL